MISIPYVLRCIVLPVMVLYILFSCKSTDGVDNYILDNVDFQEWRIDSIANGVIWKNCHFDKLFDSKQNINIIDVDLLKANVDLVYSDSLKFLTSSYGILHNGIAAVNGTFFNMKDGGSLEFLKINGKIITKVVDEERIQPFKGEAALTIDKSNNLDIIVNKDSIYYSDKYKDIISAGPLLIFNNRMELVVEDKFCLERHPRTAIGITSNNHLILFVVDGRSIESAGFTIKELALFMKSLNCIKALNMDGGGSSSMWVKNEPYNGIINKPSDNKNFDHDGERPVANAIVIKSN